MNESDIEFTVSLDTSPALQKFDEFQDHMSMADAAFQRATGQFERPSNYAQPNIGPTGANYPSSGSMADRFFEKTVSDKLAQEAEILAKSENSIYSKIRNGLLAKASAIREKFDTASNGGVPPESPNDDEDVKKTEEINQNEQEITEEAKAQNREMNEHHIKLGKTLTILGLIKASLEGIKKLWNTAFEKQANLLQTTGYLSKDPEGAFRANRDRTREMVYAGMAAWGKASPIDKGAYDELSTKIQTAREKAMKGEGVDETLTIATEYLDRKLGIGLNAVQLLTGDRSRTNTEVTNELLEKIEKALPKIAMYNEEERNRILGYLSDLIGRPLMDALMANLNLNLRTGSTETAIEKTIAKGGGAISNANVAKAAKDITEAGSSLKAAFENLSGTILVSVAPAFSDFLKNIESLTKFLSALFTQPESWLPEPLASAVKAGKWVKNELGEKTGATFGAAIAVAGAATGATPLIPLGMAISAAGSPDRGDVKDAAEFYKAHPNYKEEAKTAWAKASSFEDVYDAAIKSDERFASKRSAGLWLENQKKTALAYRLFSDYSRGVIDVPEEGVYGEIKKIVANELKKKKFTGSSMNTFLPFLQSLKGYQKKVGEFFGENRAYDATPFSFLYPSDYVQDIFGGDKQAQEFWQLDFLKSLNPDNTGGRVSGITAIPVDGKVEVTVNFTDFARSPLKVIRTEAPLTSDYSVALDYLRRGSNGAYRGTGGAK